MFGSSHIFIFWRLVDGYQMTKISGIKFVDFSKKSEYCLIFFEVRLQDSWYFGLLVAIYKKPKDKNMRWKGNYIHNTYYHTQIWCSSNSITNLKTKRFYSLNILHLIYNPLKNEKQRRSFIWLKITSNQL